LRRVRTESKEKEKSGGKLGGGRRFLLVEAWVMSSLRRAAQFGEKALARRFR